MGAYLFNIDYLHVTKRFAIVAASQLPFHYLLSAKSPWNPIQLLIKRSHEQLNPYHRLLGRVLITLFTVHATLYLNFYIQANLLGKRIRDRDVQLGLAAIISFLTIGSTALSTVREYSYRVFYVAHIILSTAILPILYYHVAYVRVYVIQTAAVHILLTIIDRYLIDQRHIVPADIYPVPNTSLISIVLRPGKHFSRNRILKPGHHIYISRAFVQEPSPIALNPMNPFSVANLPMDIAPQIHLVVRALSGTTGKLAAAAHFNPDGPYYVKMERPYASSNYFPDLLSYDRVLLVSGGVGATFTLAFYCALLGQISDLQQRDSSAAAAQAEKLRFVWTVRDIAEAWFGINTIRRQCGRLPSSFSLNITGNVDREKVPQVLFSDPSWSSDWEVMNARTNSGLPSCAPETLIVTQDKRFGDYREREEDGEDISGALNFGRLNVEKMVDDAFTRKGVERVAVLVCGPRALGRDVRRCVGDWVQEGKEVFWHEEKFGW